MNIMNLAHFTLAYKTRFLSQIYKFSIFLQMKVKRGRRRRKNTNVNKGRKSSSFVCPVWLLSPSSPSSPSVSPDASNLIGGNGKPEEIAPIPIIITPLLLNRPKRPMEMSSNKLPPGDTSLTQSLHG